MDLRGAKADAVSFWQVVEDPRLGFKLSQMLAAMGDLHVQRLATENSRRHGSAIRRKRLC
jgi:hypothetical protein